MKTKKKNKIDQEKDEEIRKLYAENMRVIDIANKYNISTSYVYSILENVVFNNQEWHIPKRNTETIRRALELRSMGLSFADISRNLSSSFKQCSSSLVRYWINSRGYKYK